MRNSFVLNMKCNTGCGQGAARQAAPTRTQTNRVEGQLSSQSGDKRLQDCGKQKGKNEVRSNSAGRVIFPNFRHGASQG